MSAVSAAPRVGALAALVIPARRRTAEVIAVEPTTDDRLLPQLDAA